MARYKLAQYAQPQNDLSTGSRTLQGIFAFLKIIFRPSPYANLLTSSSIHFYLFINIIELDKALFFCLM
ncbi:MAG: hypothetical protein ACH346_03955 [Chthoniobacterales bacterium]